MMKPILRFAVLGLALAAPSHMASAQSSEPSIASPDAASLQLAREIIDLGMPEENREAIFFTTMDQMMSQMRSAQLNTGVENDPNIDAIVDEHLERFRLDAQAILSDELPNIMEGWALAYANIFSLEELRDIRNFVATPSGQRFFELSAAIVAEPNFAAANQRYMDSIMARLPLMQIELRDALLEYLSSLPPETEES